ncbi:MAG: tetratricopeptide repeat protein, partial [Bacteroidetes bacterium]|nr:tetratricopeptide repeat protein [Bacteroidota bacterium]
MRLISFFTAVFIFVFIPLKAEINTDMQKAEELYKAGDYNASVLLYEKLVKEDGYRSANLYYNLGNAYFKLTDYSNSILNYERALKMNPADDDIRFNLELANTHIEDKIETVPVLFYKRWFMSLRNSAGQDTWAWLFIISFFACGGLFFLFVRAS